MTFNELNISKQILMALEDAGFEQPTPIQDGLSLSFVPERM